MITALLLLATIIGSPYNPPKIEVNSAFRLFAERIRSVMPLAEGQTIEIAQICLKKTAETKPRKKLFFGRAGLAGSYIRYANKTDTWIPAPFALDKDVITIVPESRSRTPQRSTDEIFYETTVWEASYSVVNTCISASMFLDGRETEKPDLSRVRLTLQLLWLAPLQPLSSPISPEQKLSIRKAISAQLAEVGGDPAIFSRLGGCWKKMKKTRQLASVFRRWKAPDIAKLLLECARRKNK